MKADLTLSGLAVLARDSDRPVKSERVSSEAAHSTRVNIAADTWTWGTIDPGGNSTLRGNMFSGYGED